MRLLIASNREPLQRTDDGGWEPSVGGLTTALLPVLERHGGVWVAWGEEDAEGTPTIEYPPDDPVLEVSRIGMSDEEVDNFYYGFANRVLWPVCHLFNERMDIRARFWEDYEAINRRFAERIVEVYEPGDRIWIQDYHLMLVPHLLREALPDATIGFFFHIPFPPPEMWRVLPWADRLTRGLLGADLVGFHTASYGANFAAAATALNGAERTDRGVTWHDRHVRIGQHPIGIDTDRFSEMVDDEDVRAEAERLRNEYGTEFVLIGVDRLDYTKGVPERLQAFEAFLDEHPDLRERVTFVQISAPSRTRIDAYQEITRQVDEISGRINGRYSGNGWIPVRYFYQSHTQRELTSLYLIADAAVITPKRDGMNVVAQEFSWTTQKGVLILSHLTGAAEILEPPLTVNPYDLGGVADAIERALSMPADERRSVMRPVRDRVREHDVHGWADRFLADLDDA